MTWKNTKLDKKKLCRRCGVPSHLDNFYVDKRTGKPGARCKRCCITYSLEKASELGSRAWYMKRYHKIKARALQRGITFTLSFEEFMKIRTGSCYYCGAKPEILSIDRVDPTQEYLSTNCVASCMDCNLRKGAVTPEICRRVVDFYK